MSDHPVIICTGKTSKKFINGGAEKLDVIPFVGQKKPGQWEEFGIGIIVQGLGGEQKYWVWGLLNPHHLIRSWRAMKLLEEIPQVRTANTLCHCWYLAGERLHDSEIKYLDKEGVAYGKYEEFRILRAKILDMFPTETELDTMATNMANGDVRVDPREIVKERRRLSSADQILDRLRLVDEERVRRRSARRKAEADRSILSNETTVPQNKSFFQRWFL